MAVVVDVLQGVREEVIGRIVALTPNRMVKAQASFVPHISDTLLTDIKAERSRLFEIGQWMQKDKWHIGYTTTGSVYTADIMFVYERTRVWNMAAVDDIHRINTDLLLYPTAVAGCGLRVLSQGPPLFTIAQKVDSKWDYYTVKLECFASVTATRG